MALGARRGRIARQLFTESLLLGAGGVAIGLALAWVAIQSLTALVPVLPVDVVVDFRPDWRVVAFSSLLGLSASVICGLAPAAQASRGDLLSAIRPDASSQPHRQMTRQVWSRRASSRR